MLTFFFSRFFSFSLFFSIFENENTHINIYGLFIKNKECHSKGLYEVELSWKFEANPSINGEETLRAVDKRCDFRRKFDVTTKMLFYWFFNDQQLYWPHCSIFYHYSVKTSILPLFWSEKSNLLFLKLPNGNL